MNKQIYLRMAGDAELTHQIRGHADVARGCVRMSIQDDKNMIAGFARR